jgi:DNA-binding XRE family transcriptional regulator
MNDQQKRFGDIIRDKRLAKGFSLRQFAKLVGVSPTYISQVEQGKVKYAPAADRVRKMAEVLNEPSDELIALAGRVPEGLPAVFVEAPRMMATFLREAKGLTAEELRKLIEQTRRMKEKREA